MRTLQEELGTLVSVQFCNQSEALSSETLMVVVDKPQAICINDVIDYGTHCTPRGTLGRPR